MTTVDITIAWPAGIALPLIDYSASPDHAILASGLESSVSQRRLRYSGKKANLGVSWSLGLSEYDAFKEFYLGTLNLGLNLFVMPLRYPRTSALTLWVVRFTGSYQAAFEEGRWRVESALILVGPANLPDASLLSGYGPFLLEPDSDPLYVDGHPFYVQRLWAPLYTDGHPFYVSGRPYLVQI